MYRAAQYILLDAQHAGLVCIRSMTCMPLPGSMLMNMRVSLFVTVSVLMVVTFSTTAYGAHRLTSLDCC